MVHLRSTRTVIVLLFSLIALEDFIALAQRDLAVYNYNNVIHKSDEELHVKTGMVGANSKKWLRGRKMMVEEVTQVRSTVNTGNAKTSSSEPLQSSNREEEESGIQGKPQVIEASSNHASLSSPGGSEPSASSRPHDLFQTNGKQNLLQATAEMFKMLNKDYHDKPRRHPPVNN